MKESEIATKALSGIKWTAAIRIIGQIINWGMSIIVIRYIKPEEYGLKSMAEITMGLLMIFSSGGMESALIHVKDLTDDKIKKTFGLLIAINASLFALQVVGAYPLAEYYHEPRVVFLVQAMAIGFLFVPFNSIPSALLSREMNYKMLSSVSLLTNVVGAGCTLAMALTGFGVWSLVVGPLLTAFLNAAIMNVYKPCLQFPKLSLRGVGDMAMFGGTVVLSALLWVIFSRSDIFIAGRHLTAHEVGIYAVALHLASLPVDKVIPILNQVAFPAYSKLRDNPAVVAKYFLKTLRLASLILFPVSFGLGGTAQYLIPAVLGEEWADVAKLLLLLCLVFPLRGISSLCAPMTNAMGKPGLQLKLVLMATVFMVPGFALGVEYYGVLGLILVWLCIYPLVMASNLWSSKNVVDLRGADIVMAVSTPLFMASIMLLGLLCFSSLQIIIVNVWTTLGIMFFAGTFIYIAGMFVLSVDRLRELLNIINK